MSMRAAINAECRECTYDSAAPGTWRQQVEACTVVACALFHFRPKSAPKRTAESMFNPTLEEISQ